MQHFMRSFISLTARIIKPFTAAIPLGSFTAAINIRQRCCSYFSWCEQAAERNQARVWRNRSNAASSVASFAPAAIIFTGLAHALAMLTARLTARV